MLVRLGSLILPLLTAGPATALLATNETSTTITLANDRITFGVDKATGYMTTVRLGSTNLLGDRITSTNAIGPYLDGIFTTDQKLTTVGTGGSYQLIEGTDAGGVKWGGVVISQNTRDAGLVARQYWFLRETETSLHGFTRITYDNAAKERIGVLTELRTLFRPHSSLWTHMSSQDDFYVPQPRPNPAIDAKNDLGTATLVQDTTWFLANRTSDPYVSAVADYWTKYSMSEVYGDHTVHGIFADGSTSNGTTYGAWMVYNSKDTFYGGPTYSDLTVDGIVYNYLVSNHHGNQPPNITHGFARTWGPSIYHFNSGSASKDGDVRSSMAALRADAGKLADMSQHTAFYQSVAPHVEGYVSAAGRGSWQGHVSLPKGASNPVAVLSAPGYDYQDNAHDTAAYQYWADVAKNGKVQIPNVKAGTYRLTLYADGLFGDFVASESVVVSAGKVTDSKKIAWVPEAAGTELWRIGTPDKSAGEFRHGYARSARGLRVPQYRVYWGAYDFVDDFPSGVEFTVGKSKESEDWNYVHWASFGSSMTRPGIYSGETISNWTIKFPLGKNALKKTTTATLTVQFAGVTTDAGNTDVFNPNSPWSNLEFGVVVNGNKLQSHIIPYYHSGSCATRSGITCYTERAKFTFPTSYLSAEGDNQIILVLPFNATGTAVVPTSINVMYDALRLEVQ